MDWPADSSGLETVERATLQEQIYRQLRDRIMSGFFQPGQALSTRSVAEAVGVSVMPVRDALRRLEVENALVVGHNRALEIPRLDTETLNEISATRIALEGLAVERAQPALGQADIGALEDICAQMTESIRSGDTDGYLAANWAFHSRIYRCASDGILLSFIESLWLRMGPYFRLTAGDRAHLDNAMIIHHDIVQALEKGDAASARSGIVADIEAAVHDLSDWLASDTGSAAAS
ncbi:GntR family transcriptional regulator [Hoeflea poritis]|uniref:GntR family transcriptional regulator n=1 Tax=Hoeflea poritis TaxID=2993659 RepID=A0ABT4VW82_9HYPH|nr:GntR family transcriptional regulator [Hoeflea poritis]MDA4848317.1 GntR family transcriptional regulator [Hoeflea poritis]